jgi:O-antigen ligase
MSLTLDRRTFAGIAALGAFWGVLVAVAGLNALYLFVSLLACVFILLDFRIGVVLLILLMPISTSEFFPHAMFGITGLNPMNPLLLGTLVSYLFRDASEGHLGRFMPRPLLWLYVVPIVAAGVLGSVHFKEIPPALFMYEIVGFKSVADYFRDLVMKPMFMVIFALLVGAAVAKAKSPERFLVAALASVWVMGSMVILFVLSSGIGLSELAGSGSREFLSPLGMHANDLGRLYVIAYAILLFTRAESGKSGMRLALLASMGLMAVALVLTFSRGAFVGFAVVNVLFVLWRRNVKTLVTFAILAALALFLLPAAVYDRIGTGYGGGADAISAGRIDLIWLPLLPEVLRSPILGNGLGSILWSEAMRKGAGVTIAAVTHPHNAYLQALLDMGISGLVLLCAYLAHVWKGFGALSVDPQVSPLLRGFYLGAKAGLASFLIAAATDGSLTPKPEQVYLWLAIGMMYGQLARKMNTRPGSGR